MKNKTTSLGISDYVTLLWVFVILLLAGGWISNIVKLIGMLDGQVTAMFVARIVGMFALPLGGVLGYF